MKGREISQETYYGQDGNTEDSTQSLMLRMEKKKYFGRYLECRIDKTDGKLDVAIERIQISD